MRAFDRLIKKSDQDQILVGEVILIDSPNNRIRIRPGTNLEIWVDCDDSALSELQVGDHAAVGRLESAYVFLSKAPALQPSQVELSVV